GRPEVRDQHVSDLAVAIDGGGGEGHVITLVRRERGARVSEDEGLPHYGDRGGGVLVEILPRLLLACERMGRAEHEQCGEGSRDPCLIPGGADHWKLRR